MKRGGFDSYRTDEALQQAKERGENVGWDRLFGVAGTVGEAIWLAILVVAIAWLATHALIATHVLVLGLLTTGSAAVAAPRLAAWLVRPFADSIFRRLLWGLATAATLLLLVRTVLAILLVIQLRLQGVGGEAAGVGAFQGAAWFTLMIALPTWLLYALWGWLRRRSLVKEAGLPGWRRALPIVLVIGTMIFMGAEGAYFDSVGR
ncbi:hypothetical protein [Reyranella sp.]|uniref:hypothetical protein n=1 Tax=Reyranella sp. TaxID=1929291 RepID=UPI003BACB543